MHIRGADSFMSVLRLFACLEYSALRRVIFPAEFAHDIFTRRLCRFIGNAERVCSHICDDTVASAEFLAEVYALIELLRNLHYALGLETETL